MASARNEGGRSLSEAGDADVEVELVARVDPGPIRSAATRVPSNAAIAVIKPAIAVTIPGMEFQNPPAALSSPTMSPPPSCILNASGSRFTVQRALSSTFHAIVVIHGSEQSDLPWLQAERSRAIA